MNSNENHSETRRKRETRGGRKEEEKQMWHIIEIGEMWEFTKNTRKLKEDTVVKGISIERRH